MKEPTGAEGCTLQSETWEECSLANLFCNEIGLTGVTCEGCLLIKWLWAFTFIANKRSPCVRPNSSTIH